MHIPFSTVSILSVTTITRGQRLPSQKVSPSRSFSSSPLPIPHSCFLTLEISGPGDLEHGLDLDFENLQPYSCAIVILRDVAFVFSLSLGSEASSRVSPSFPPRCAALCLDAVQGRAFPELHTLGAVSLASVFALSSTHCARPELGYTGVGITMAS